MGKSLPTFGSAIRDNEKLRRQISILQSKHNGDQHRIDALLKQNRFLKKQLKEVVGGNNSE